MANLEQIVTQKAEKDTRWREQQQAERENTVAMQDAGIEQITNSPEAYARYLDMQGDNPTYSGSMWTCPPTTCTAATIFCWQEPFQAVPTKRRKPQLF